MSFVLNFVLKNVTKETDISGGITLGHSKANLFAYVDDLELLGSTRAEIEQIRKEPIVTVKKAQKMEYMIWLKKNINKGNL